MHFVLILYCSFTAKSCMKQAERIPVPLSAASSSTSGYDSDVEESST